MPSPRAFSANILRWRGFASPAAGAGKSGTGFTLIETLVVIGLVGLIAMVGVLMSYSSMGRSSVAGERDLFVSLLLSSRARALANVKETPHGIRINVDSFVLFEGGSWPGANQRAVSRNSAIGIEGPGEIIIFEQLSGNISAGAGEYALSNGAQSATIDITAVGGIDW